MVSTLPNCNRIEVMGGWFAYKNRKKNKEEGYYAISKIYTKSDLVTTIAVFISNGSCVLYNDRK